MCLLSIAPAAANLFRNAIIESGPCIGNWGPSSAVEGWNNTRAIMASRGVSTVSALSHLAPERLFWINPTNGWFQDPLLDGKATRWYFEEGRLNPDSLAIGATSLDGTSFLKPTFPSLPSAFKADMLAAWSRPMTPQGIKTYPYPQLHP